VIQKRGSRKSEGELRFEGPHFLQPDCGDTYLRMQKTNTHFLDRDSLAAECPFGSIYSIIAPDEKSVSHQFFKSKGNFQLIYIASAR
jgi:hypothetical protein